MTELIAKDLSVFIPTPTGGGYAVNKVSFSVKPGQVVCLVGESGCGKSTTALALMRLLPDSCQLSGTVNVGDQSLLTLSEDEMCAVRGNKLAMVFQEPMTALNPVKTIGAQIAESMLVHKKVSREQAKARSISLLEQVGIPEPAMKARLYPHQLSGGQRQRVVIAMALSCNPEFIIADEPTTALDTTVQKQILKLLLKMVDTTGMGLVVITHNLAIVSEIADQVLVMYAGQIIESGSVSDIFTSPAHPYTQGLLAALPANRTAERLQAIPGSVPPLQRHHQGCIFANRCAYAQPDCLNDIPVLESLSEGHDVRCFYAGRLVPAVRSHND